MWRMPTDNYKRIICFDWKPTFT